MLDFRRNAKAVLAAVKRGERLVLTYRGEPIARIEPIADDARSIPANDPLLRVEDFAVDGPGGALTAEMIDRLVHG
jgi:prevent-host-death family protein